MKRTHIHVNVEPEQLADSVDFYATMFGSPPAIRRDNYAKWNVEDPPLNFVVEVLEIDGDRPGIHHVGIQVESGDELNAMKKALRDAERPLLDIGRTHCCFAESEKHWTVDPQGVRWETFRSFGQTEDYGAKTDDELRNYTARPESD